MGLFKDISIQLASVITAIQQNGQAAFEHVVRKPQTDFDGYPAVVINAARVDSDYSTNVHNHRRYIFDVHILNLLDKDADSQVYLERQDELMDLVDLILNAIDQTANLNGVVDFVDPVPSQFFEVQTSRGPALVAPIRVTCRKDIQVRTSF